MGAEVFMASVEDRKLQCVNNAADGIDDASDKQPEEGFSGKTVENLCECQDTGPSHTDIEQGRNPFRAVDPEGFEKNSEDSNTPDDSKQGISEGPANSDQADRCIRSCNKDGNHHMVKFFQTFIDFFINIQRVIKCTGSVEQQHTYNKDTQ